LRPNQDKIIALNTILTHYANANAVTFVDCHSTAMMIKWIATAYSNDGVHPNKADYEVMAPLLEKAIEFTSQNSSKHKTNPITLELGFL
jgi:lysophospholipase L1-like esterase